MPGNFFKFGTRLGRVCVVTALWFHLPSSPSKPQVAERTTLHNAHDQLCIQKVKYILSVTISHVHLDDDSNGTQPPSCFGKITTQKGNL